MKQDVARIYRWVIDDVLAKTKPEFVSEGIQESTMLELRRRWEQKLQETGVLDEDRDEPGPSTKSEQPSTKQEDSAAGGSGSVKRGVKRQRQVDSAAAAASGIPQQDGPADPSGLPEAEEEEDEDEGLPTDEDEDEDEGVGVDETDDQDFLCALFEKVKKQKNIWKVNLRAGIFHINGKEYLFSKGACEFEFM